MMVNMLGETYPVVPVGSAEKEAFTTSVVSTPVAVAVIAEVQVADDMAVVGIPVEPVTSKVTTAIFHTGASPVPLDVRTCPLVPADPLNTMALDIAMAFTVVLELERVTMFG